MRPRTRRNTAALWRRRSSGCAICAAPFPIMLESLPLSRRSWRGSSRRDPKTWDGGPVPGPAPLVLVSAFAVRAGDGARGAQQRAMRVERARDVSRPSMACANLPYWAFSRTTHFAACRPATQRASPRGLPTCCSRARTEFISFSSYPGSACPTRSCGSCAARRGPPSTSRAAFRRRVRHRSRRRRALLGDDRTSRFDDARQTV